jgi:broad specificity phosphatase PhoE
MIVLIRHSTPIIDYSRCDNKVACDRLNEYNRTDNINISEIERFSSEALAEVIFNKEIIVYSSPIPRAEITCRKLFSNYDYKLNDSLKEVELKIINLPFIKLKLKTWFLLSRLRWLAGIGSETETVRDAKRRANHVVNNILQDDVAIVSHGFFIHYLKKILCKKKYKVTNRYRCGCFTVEILNK